MKSSNKQQLAAAVLALGFIGGGATHGAHAQGASDGESSVDKGRADVVRGNYVLREEQEHASGILSLEREKEEQAHIADIEEEKTRREVARMTRRQRQLELRKLEQELDMASLPDPTDESTSGGVTENDLQQLLQQQQMQLQQAKQEILQAAEQQMRAGSGERASLPELVGVLSNRAAMFRVDESVTTIPDGGSVSGYTVRNIDPASETAVLERNGEQQKVMMR